MGAGGRVRKAPQRARSDLECPAMARRITGTAPLARLALLAWLVAPAAQASLELARIPFDDTPPGSTALGAGFRMGSSLYRASTDEEQRRQDLIPLYLYNGRYLFARGSQFGVHALRNERFQLNLLASYRFEQLDPNRNAYYAGMAERRQTLEAGLELRSINDWGELTASFLTDALGRHDGQAAELSYRYPIEFGRWTVTPFVAYGWTDDQLSDYYYGVLPSEAVPGRPAYAPGETNWGSYGVNTSWWVTDRINLYANLGFNGPDEELQASPLVAEATRSTLYFGGTYLFGNAVDPSQFVSEDRIGEWYWRVNYGYQVQGNIVGEVDQGDWERSRVADTNIGGASFGLLLQDGERIDFQGRFAVFRHFEEDEGNGNFSSVAAYVMAVGTGYSPWSDEELFRWGFGFGFSYADKVPIAEQRKQANKGGNTAHFLNYLEMTVDFPMHRIFRSESLRGCYTGLTIVHRSGIFGSSDLLGDVSGGSDWLTAHVECAVR